ncbi:BTAD domain-containing putative transcriptional regulator [Terrabacter sp. MAHUQ-38]|uniref:BTAD domain-containing putative transcriptional regulator n=1 Tax=unclassified Terrabacter TaxID=2630222 RepID=UPI00165DACD1|nr:BTAD domain-containing putative transcriptional regulator [Terrabacter sp. MAHUQ-38]MBC9820390.1 AAA family ATPase [Terrabacter sp. MAHUQ-38]
MRVFVLGGSRVERAPGAPADADQEHLGEPAGLRERVDLGARKPRSIVAALAMRPGRPVPVDLLADLVWAGEPPPAAHGALHAYISGLRKALEPGRRGRSAPSVLGRSDHGYVLSVPRDAVDTHRFAVAVRDAERSLAPLGTQFSTGLAKDWPSRTEVVSTLDRLDEALALWVGEPYADLPDHPDVLAERASLERLRAAAEETRLLGLLALGEHVNVLATTEPLTTLHPTRERLHALHALALVRGGRQVEALDHLRDARAHLADELGLDPGPELRDAEQAVLRQEPGLLEWLRPHSSRSGARSPSQEPSPGRGTLGDATSTAGAHDGSAVADSAGAAGAGASTPRGEEPIGRTDERVGLEQLLSDALSGRTSSALVVGEPGIGKSWLVRYLTERARGLGFVVASGSCSQDDGAPPLWPWLSVLHALDEQAPGGGDDKPSGLAEMVPDTTDLGPGRSAFQTWQRVASAVLAASARVPVLVVLDDLHWADDATLRALRHLLEVAPETARLFVVGTRRSHPEPSGALAEVGEAFARRQGLRLDLVGLPGADAAELVHSVVAGVPAGTVNEWHTRTGGNPFFLLELARLGAAGSTGVHGGGVPATVREVVMRRVAQLPGATIAALGTAAVVGRSFRAETVAAADQDDPDETAESLEPAHAAGLLVDHEADGFAFAHALAREAVYLSIPQRRRARLHAQIAHALATNESLRAAFTPDELTAELARHWLASGPSHAEQAWRAAGAAATQARNAAAYRDAMRMRSEAVAAHRRVPGASQEERWDLLLELARDAAYAAHWPQVVDAALEALELGRSLGSPDRVARAAAAISHYCVWMPHSWLEVFEDAIDDLRWALRTLSETDSPTRALLLLSLAVELYYDQNAPAERAALVDAGLAVARRIGDPELLSWATRAAWIASWSPSRTEARLGIGAEGVAAARAAGDPVAEAVSLLTLATDHLELGQVDEWTRLAGQADRIARRERLPFVIYTYNWVELCLAAMRGDDGEAQRLATVALDLASQVALPAEHLAKPVIALIAGVWRVPIRTDVSFLRLLALEPMARATAHALLGRAGRADLVEEEVREHPYVRVHENWQTLLTECLEAEATSYIGHEALARQAVAELEPWSGRIALSGVSVVIGPVDGYLALAQVTVGDLSAGLRSAARAFADAERWGFTAYAEWLTRNLERLGVDAETLAP